MPDVGIFDPRALSLPLHLAEQYKAIRVAESVLAELLGQVIYLHHGRLLDRQDGAKYRRRVVLMTREPSYRVTAALMELEALKTSYMSGLKGVELATRDDPDRIVGSFETVGDQSMGAPVVITRAGRVPLTSDAPGVLVDALADRASRVTYAERVAWRVGDYTMADIETYFTMRIEKRQTALDAARAAYKHDRVREITQGIEGLEGMRDALRGAVGDLTAAGRAAILRMASGQGDDLRARFENPVTSVGFAVPNVAIIASTRDAELRHAHRRRRVGSMELIRQIGRIGVFSHRQP